MNAHFPITFSILLNGKRQAAHLETILDAGSFNVFSIGFGDGYQDCFFDKGDGYIRGINEQRSKSYANALKHELHVFNYLKERVALENFPYEQDGQFANGWVFTKKEANGLVYTVYLKGVYQFDIVEKEKGWTAVAEKGAGRQEIDQKLANYAFKWVTTPVESVPVSEEEACSAIEQKPLDRPVEFMLDFEFKGTRTMAFGLLLDTRPWKQCTVAIKANDVPAVPELFQFFKIDNKDQLFSWIPYSGTKEKMARTIAAALEKRFSKNRVFSTN